MKSPSRMISIVFDHSQEHPFVLQVVPLFQFVLFALISCPPNFLWQMFLEETFPGHPRGSKKLDTMNTARKFALDQSIGALFNTIAFIAAMSALKGQDLQGISRDVNRVCPGCSCCRTHR